MFALALYIHSNKCGKINGNGEGEFGPVEALWPDYFHISMFLKFTMNIFRYLKCVSNESVPLIPHTMELFDQIFVWSDLLQKNKNSSFMMMR